MKGKSALKTAFVASYIPRRCGIATFTNDLLTNSALHAGEQFEPIVIALQPDGREVHYSEPVKFEIRQQIKNDYICAADYINFSHVDLISLQHEFGLFGGKAGSYINLLLQRVNAPVVTTMHTVIDEPEEDFYKATVDVCTLSDKVVVMNERGLDMLRNIYGIPPAKMELIPHGLPDLPFVDSSYYKHKFGMDGRRTILTFGLLSRNKGIEMMLDALPDIIREDPSVLYIVLGATHPGVLKYEGEQYRFSLQQKVKALGLQDHVIFHNRYVNDGELHNFLCSADLYVTPYLNREQLTSGTLAFAVGAGKAVISTPYWAAEELLSEGRGVLVNFNDPKVLAVEIIDILRKDQKFYSLRRKAYDYGRNLTWPRIGKVYWKLFRETAGPAVIHIKPAPGVNETAAIMEVPEPPLEHLIRMTDDTGLYQHAKFIIPDREHGYCTDDNARAVIVANKYYAQYADEESFRLFNIYLSFIYNACKNDGTVYNFMNYDRTWVAGEPVHDALGRTLWAFGSVIARPPLAKYISIIKDCFDRSIVHTPSLAPRGMAYAVFGMTEYLKQFPGASEIKRLFAIAAGSINELYRQNSSADWQWFENILTYDNAVLVDAMFRAAAVMDNKQYLDTALATCDFLIENTFINGRFSPIGCKGWYPKDGERARFDQQPLEAVSTIMMLSQAYAVTKKPEYLKLQKKTFDWFLGDNDLQMPVYDFRTRGCGDGLEQSGVNLNQGAESLLAFLMGLLCLLEGYNLNMDQQVEKTGENEKPSAEKIRKSSRKSRTSESILEKLI